MNVKDLLLLLSGCILSSNFVLVRFFASESLLGLGKNNIERNMKTALLLSLTLILSSVILYPLEALLLSSSGDALRGIVYTVVILLVETIVSKTAKAKKPVSLLVTSAVLGPVLFFESEGYSFPVTLISSIGVSLAYLVVTLAFSSVKEKISDKYIPSAFRGAPIYFIALSIIALTVYCF